jgi:hypothetical protein
MKVRERHFASDRLVSLRTGLPDSGAAHLRTLDAQQWNACCTLESRREQHMKRLGFANGLTWHALAALSLEQIRSRGVFPRAERRDLGTYLYVL